MPEVSIGSCEYAQVEARFADILAARLDFVYPPTGEVIPETGVGEA
jgi:hypothetical protein